MPTPTFAGASAGKLAPAQDPDADAKDARRLWSALAATALWLVGGANQAVCPTWQAESQSGVILLRQGFGEQAAAAVHIHILAA
jgi:hypothetical protein